MELFYFALALRPSDKIPTGDKSDLLDIPTHRYGTQPRRLENIPATEIEHDGESVLVIDWQAQGCYKLIFENTDTPDKATHILRYDNVNVIALVS